jgi:hypothetical protein
MTSARAAAVLSAMVVAGSSLGCGSGDAVRTHTAKTNDLAVPARVPSRATGPADRSSTRVIRAWLSALRRGDIDKAASYFANPSLVQNGTPVLKLDSELERRAFNISLPCGAVAIRTGGAGRFTIVVFRLTERRNGDCMGGAGELARGAIRVERGRIAEWYRLVQPGQRAPIPPGLDPGRSQA